MDHELRSARLELRAGDKFQLIGVAASTGVMSAPLPTPNGYTFREVIAPGAFSRALREEQDVRCLYNHDPNRVLGRTKSGTLLLSETRDGSLGFTCQLDKEQRSHHEVHAAVKRGDISEMSFAFNVHGDGDSFEQRKIDGKPTMVRTLKDLDLHDISPVLNPAYPSGTQVSARCAAEARAVAARSLRLLDPLQAPAVRELREHLLQQRCKIFSDHMAAGGYMYFAGNEETGEGEFMLRPLGHEPLPGDWRHATDEELEHRLLCERAEKIGRELRVQQALDDWNKD